MNVRNALSAMAVATVLLLTGCGAQTEREPEAAVEQLEAAFSASEAAAKTQPASETLSVEFPDEGHWWIARIGGKRLLFRDANGDGLSESCDVYEGERRARTVVFCHREYFADLAAKGKLKEGEIGFLLAKLETADVVGVNLLIPPKPPLTTAPTRSARVTDRATLDRLVHDLRTSSYRWITAERITYGTADMPGYGVSGGDGMRPTLPLWLTLEIWLRDEPEPLTVQVCHLDNSYALHLAGMWGEWKDRKGWFANDDVALLLARLFVLRWPYEVTVYGYYGREEVTWPARCFPTYFGGIGVFPDGRASHPPTRDEKIKETEALIEAHRFDLLEESGHDE